MKRAWSAVRKHLPGALYTAGDKGSPIAQRTYAHQANGIHAFVYRFWCPPAPAASACAHSFPLDHGERPWTSSGIPAQRHLVPPAKKSSLRFSEGWASQRSIWSSPGWADEYGDSKSSTRVSAWKEQHLFADSSVWYWARGAHAYTKELLINSPKNLGNIFHCLVEWCNGVSHAHVEGPGLRPPMARKCSSIPQNKSKCQGWPAAPHSTLSSPPKRYAPHGPVGITPTACGLRSNPSYLRPYPQWPTVNVIPIHRHTPQGHVKQFRRLFATPCH